MKVSDIAELYESGVKKVFKTVKGKEFEIEIKKFGTDELPLLSSLFKIKEGLEEEEFSPETAEAMKKLVAVVLRRSLEDATDKDNLELPLNCVFELLEGVMEANKDIIDEESKIDKETLEKIKKRQEGLVKKNG